MFNMFFEIFVSLTVEDLSKINFIKHILGEQNGGGGLFGDARSGSADDALEILAVLMREHRTVDGDQPDPIDITLLLGDNKTCRDRLNQYMQKSNSEVVTKAMQQFKAAQTKAIATRWDDDRPKKWEDDNFKSIPIQEGEEGEIEDTDDTVQLAPVPDPLGLSELDLRATQKLNASGRLLFPAGAGMNRGGGGAQGGTRARRNSATSMDDEDDADGKEAMELASVLPQDKSFSPSLFLTLVHGGISFEQLKIGMDNLSSQLQQQNSQRENLVRMHFGLFVQCAEGLEWLKGYRKGLHGGSVGGGTGKALSVKGDTGEQMLSRAKVSLESAKGEATDTLRPILDRMRRMRKLKTADQVLRRLTPTLEHPHKMRLALNRGDFDEVISIYQRVQAIPNSSQLRVVQSVKSGAEAIVEDLKLRCRASLDAPEADVNVLLRYAKIIAALEGDDSYREHLRLCFAAQLGHFNAHLDALMARFANDAYVGFNQVRDSRAEAEAEAKANAAHGRNAQQRASVLSGSVSTSTSSASLQSVQEWLPELGPDEEVLRARLTSFGSRVTSGVFQLNNDDDYYFDGMADPVGVSSVSTAGTAGSAVGIFPPPLTNEDDDRPLGVVLDEEARRNQFLLATRVRELLSARLISAANRWLPCLHRLLTEATSKQAVGGMGLWTVGGGDKAERAKFNLTLNRKKGPPPLLMLGSAMIACGEAIRMSILGVGDPSKYDPSSTGLAGGLENNNNGTSGVIFASGHIAGRDPSFEAKIFNQERMVEVRSTPVFNHEAYTGPISDPALSRCVSETGDLFDLMSSLGIGGGPAGNDGQTYATNSAAAAAAAATVKHSELFLHAVAIVRDLARGGEIKVAQRVMERLKERALALFESREGGGQQQTRQTDRIGRVEKSSFGAIVGAGSSSSSSSSGGGGGGSAADLTSGDRHDSMENAVMQLNKLATKCLQRLSKKLRRPEWASQTVRDRLRQIFSGFSDEMQRESLVLGDDREVGRQLARSTSKRGRARTVTASALQSPELLMLEAELKQGEVSAEVRSDYLLDLIRACAIMRTLVIPKLWKETKLNFPPSTDTSIGGGGRSADRDSFFSAVGSGGAPIRKIPSNTALAAAAATAALASPTSSGLYNRLMKTVSLTNDTFEANVNIEEIVRIESVAVSNYVALKLQGLRVAVTAGYGVLTKRETAGAWRATENRPDGFVVPPHLSRLLLTIGCEKSFLGGVMGGMTIETGELAVASTAAGTALGGNERYDEFLFREICVGFLSLYAEIVTQLNLSSMGGSMLPSGETATHGGQLASALSGSMSAECQHPFSYGQASEELSYLISIIRPLLNPSLLPPLSVIRGRAVPSGAGEEFLSAAELLRECTIFHLGVQR